MTLRSRRGTGRVFAVPVGGVLSNVLAYGLLLLAAHTESASQYGELVALLNVLLIGTVPSLALQTAAARRAATRAGEQGLDVATALLGFGAAAFVLVISPALGQFLHLRSLLGLAAVAAALPATAALGTAMGLEQGARRFWRLAAITFAFAVGRSGGGLVGLAIGRTPEMTMWGAAVGTTISAVITLAVTRTLRWRRQRAGSVAVRHVIVEVAHAAHAHGAFLLLTSLDVLLARHVLTADDAGLYAAGSVITRAALWLPQSILLLVFARLTDPAQHHRLVRRAGSLVIALGALAVLGVAVAGDLAVTIVGGKYHELATTGWVFALLGACLAVMQFAVLAGLAVQRRRLVTILWLTMLADTLLVLRIDDHAGALTVVATVTVVAAVGAIATFALAARDQSAASTEAVQLPVSPGQAPGA